MTALITVRRSIKKMLLSTVALLVVQASYAQHSTAKVATTNAPKQDTLLPQPGYDMLNYIAHNIKIPDTANLSEWGSRCIVRFDIDTAGRPGNITIIRHVSPAYDKEITRLIKAMPPWQPGKVNGKPATLEYTLPLILHLE